MSDAMPDGAPALRPDASGSAAGPRRGGARAWLLPVALTLLYLVLAATTLRTVAPSGDGVLVWADPVPHRIVLCVERDGGALVLATGPDDGLRAALDVPLDSNQVVRGGEAFGAVLSDHSYNARLRFGPLDLPWMRNGYSSGIPDWIPRLLAMSPLGWRAGVGWNILLGGLALLLVLLLAGRFGGPWAVVVAGCLLVAEPQFHYYKRNLGGTEVWLQLLGVAVLALVWLAWRRGWWRPLAVAALLGGVGLHVKLSFVAVLAGLGLVCLVLAAWRPLVAGRSAGRVQAWLALLAALLALGVAPTFAYHRLRATSEVEYGTGYVNQPTIRGAMKDLRQRLARSAPPWLGPGGEEARGDVEPTRGGKEQSLSGVLFAPADGIRRHFARRAAGSNEAAMRGEAPAEPRAAPLLARLARPLTALLLLLGLAGGLRSWRTARGREHGDEVRLLAWGGLLVLVLPLVVRVVEPDPHNMAMVRPLMALGGGLGVAGLLGRPGVLLPWVGRPLVVVVALLATLTLCGRAADLATLDAHQDETVGRLLDLRNQKVLAETLEELGAGHPAVFEHELMSIVEAHTGGRVRPVHYARSSLGQASAGCSHRREPAWLESIVAAHVDSHLVVAWGPAQSPGAARSVVDPEEIRAAAAARGLRVEPVRKLRDGRGRWYATIWRVEG